MKHVSSVSSYVPTILYTAAAVICSEHYVLEFRTRLNILFCESAIRSLRSLLHNHNVLNN